jgi:hypothetical protein
MTDLEKRAITALQDVVKNQQSWHERRARQLWFRMQGGESAQLVVTERGDLWFLVWHYRRQVKDAGVVAEADRLVNGAMHLAFDYEESLAKG